MNLKQSLHEPIIINDIFSYLCPSAEIYRKWTVTKTLNIDEPLKAIKVIDFLFFSFVLGLIDMTEAGYYYLPAIAFKAAAAERTRLWHASYFLTTLLTVSDPLQVLKSLLMSKWVESVVLHEGDSAGVPQDSF